MAKETASDKYKREMLDSVKLKHDARTGIAKYKKGKKIQKKEKELSEELADFRSWEAKDNWTTKLKNKVHKLLMGKD